MPIDRTEKEHNIYNTATYASYKKENKKLSYPQRKRASNMALLYGAKGISV